MLRRIYRISCIQAADPEYYCGLIYSRLLSPAVFKRQLKSFFLPERLVTKFLPRDALYIMQVAVLRSHVVCLSVFTSVTLVDCDHVEIL